jgi:hypothetical protein
VTRPAPRSQGPINRVGDAVQRSRDLVREALLSDRVPIRLLDGAAVLPLPDAGL